MLACLLNVEVHSGSRAETPCLNKSTSVNKSSRCSLLSRKTLSVVFTLNKFLVSLARMSAEFPPPPQSLVLSPLSFRERLFFKGLLLCAHNSWSSSYRQL